MAKPQTKGLLSTLLVCLQSYFALAVSPAQPSRPECYIPCDETNCGFSITCTWDPNQVLQTPTNYVLHWEPTNSGVGYVTCRTNSSGVIPREHFSSHSELRVWVQATNQDGSAKSPDAVFNTKNIKKPLPPKVTVSQQEPSEVYWNSPCDQLHFSLGSCDVRHRTEGGVWEEHNGFHNMYTFDSLQPCTTYELQIRCVCDIDLMSDWSETYRVQGPDTAPVGELDVWRDCGTFPPSTHCVLTWKRFPASQECGLILGYEVQLIYSNSTVTSVNVSTSRCDEEQCRFACSLKDASSVSVSAYNAHGTTVPSYLALPFLGQKGNKQVLHLKMNEENLIVSWDPPSHLSDNVEEYVLEYKRTGCPQGQGLDWIKVSNRTTAIIKGHFQNYTSYEVSLFAVTDNNKAHHLSSVNAYSLQRTPSKVPAITVLSIGVTQATLHWEPVPKQDGVVLLYQIEVDAGHSGGPRVHNVSASPLQKNMTHTLQDLNPGQMYKVGIRAVSEAGPGEKADTSFKTKDREDFAHWPVLSGILVVVAIVAVFILYCVCRGENKDRPLVKLCFYEKVPDPRNSHIFRQMKHQINDHMAWICIPTYEPHPKISILEVVDTKHLGSKSSLEKTSEAGRLMRPVVRQGSLQMDLQADQREDAVVEDCHRKDNKCGREAYSKMIDSDEEGGRGEEEEEDREGCWSSSEEEQCAMGYEKHFMPTASDILEVS